MEKTQNEILEQLGLADLPEKEREELLLELQELTFNGAMMRIMDSMDMKTREEFTALMEKEAPDEEVEAFLAEKVPGAEAAIADTMESLKNDILRFTDR